MQAPSWICGQPGSLVPPMSSSPHTTLTVGASLKTVNGLLPSVVPMKRGTLAAFSCESLPAANDRRAGFPHWSRLLFLPGSPSSWCLAECGPGRLASGRLRVRERRRSWYRHCLPSLFAVLTIGTSAQLAVLEPKETSKLSQDSRLLRVPFTSDGRRLLVSAAMNGGNALDNLIQVLFSTKPISLETQKVLEWGDEVRGAKTELLSLSAILEKVNAAAEEGGRGRVVVRPLFERERGAVDEGVSIQHLFKDSSLTEVLLPSPDTPFSFSSPLVRVWWRR